MGGFSSKGPLVFLVTTMVLTRSLAGLAAEQAPATGDELAQRESVNTTLWTCSLCNYPRGWYGTLYFGPGYVSDSSPKFGDYRGLEEKGVFPALDGDVHFRGEAGLYLDLYARNLGIESREFEMRGGQQGRYEVRLAYREVPRYRGNGTQTPFLDVGKTIRTLPPDWASARSTREMSALDESLQPTSLKTKRKTMDAGLAIRGQSRWSYELDFQHQNKNGNRPWAGGVFTINSSHFPAAVDFTTNQFNMGLAYSGLRSSFRFGFTGSAFNNRSSSVSWENPFTPIPGTETLRSSLEPDNNYYQFNLAGAYSPRPEIRFSGRAAAGRMTQNDPFLPYTTNPGFSDLPLPRSSLDGKVDTGTLNLAGNFSARLARRLALNARIKLDEKDNRTPVDLYTPVITDLVLKQPRPNRPYSFKKEKYDLSLRYRARGAVRLIAGLRRENVKRSLQSVEKTREDTFWGEISFNRWASAQLRLKLESSERDASPWRQLQDGGPLEHPLMRKFNMADRDRSRFRADLDLSPRDRLSINLSFLAAEDDYEDSVIGLQDSEEQSFSLDINWSIRPDVNVYGLANHQDFDSSITGAADLGSTFWHANTEDRFLTFGMGIFARVSRKVSIGFDYLSADSEGKVLTESGLGEDPFPTLETELRNARFHLSYLAGDHWGWKLLAEHETYRSKDWYVDGLGPDGIPSILTMGQLSPDHDVTVLRMMVTWRF